MCSKAKLYIRDVTGRFFHWYPPISLQKNPAKQPITAFLSNRIYWNNSCDWLIGNFLFLYWNQGVLMKKMTLYLDLGCLYLDPAVWGWCFGDQLYFSFLSVIFTRERLQDFFWTQVHLVYNWSRPWLPGGQSHNHKTKRENTAKDRNTPYILKVGFAGF